MRSNVRKPVAVEVPSAVKALKQKLSSGLWQNKGSERKRRRKKRGRENEKSVVFEEEEVEERKSLLLGREEGVKGQGSEVFRPDQTEVPPPHGTTMSCVCGYEGVVLPFNRHKTQHGPK